jgi:hypothetical protein
MHEMDLNDWLEEMRVEMKIFAFVKVNEEKMMV